MTTLSIDRQQFEFEQGDDNRFIIRNIATLEERLSIPKNPVPILDSDTDKTLIIRFDDTIIYVAPYVDDTARNADRTLIEGWTAPFSDGGGSSLVNPKAYTETQILVGTATGISAMVLFPASTTRLGAHVFNGSGGAIRISKNNSFPTGCIQIPNNGTYSFSNPAPSEVFYVRRVSGSGTITVLDY